MNNSTRHRGRLAEDQAARYLSQKGYQILARNYHARYGELDIVAQHGDCLVFVEVKQRSSDRMGLAEEALTPAKQRNLILAAQRYLQQHNWDGDIRFDVITINQGQLNHYQNALDADVQLEF